MGQRGLLAVITTEERTSYDWALNEIFAAIFNADYYNVTDLRVFTEGMKVDKTKFVDELIEKLEETVSDRCEAQGLCKECFAEMGVTYRKEYMGDYGSAKAYMDVGYSKCPECGWEG